MIKKNLRKIAGIITIGVFLFSISSLSYGAQPPTQDELTDSYQNPPPRQVLKTAEDLWKAVDKDGHAHFKSGLGYTQQPKCGCWRVFMGLTTLGFSELGICVKKYGTLTQVTPSWWLSVFESKDIRKIPADKLKDALQNYCNAVMACVAKKEANVGKLQVPVGKYLMDGSYVENINTITDLASARRDTSRVIQTTLAFVNANGGWLHNESSTKKSLKKHKPREEGDSLQSPLLAQQEMEEEAEAV